MEQSAYQRQFNVGGSMSMPESYKPESYESSKVTNIEQITEKWVRFVFFY